jgi:hypothetical protein
VADDATLAIDDRGRAFCAAEIGRKNMRNFFFAHAMNALISRVANIPPTASPARQLS